MNQHIEHAGHHTRIHIDQHPLESPNPTTGSALYALGQVAPGLELFKEVEGDHEDVAIPNDGTAVHLFQDEHFHSGAVVVKLYHIVVNAEAKEVNHKTLTFMEVLLLAFPHPLTGPNVVTTITFKKAAGPEHSGSLQPGETVNVKDGTIFHVTQTDKS
jgi:hypothetical protein